MGDWGGFSKRHAERIGADAVPRPEPMRAWSYSRWAKWSECPRRAYYAHVEKLPEPQGQAAGRGERIHAAAESYLRAVRRPRLPAELAHYDAGFAQLRRGGARPEVPIVLDAEWQPIRSEDAWMAPEAWLRARIDAVLCDGPEGEDADRRTLIDFKTGRCHPPGTKYTEQLSLYALLAFLRWPGVETVRCAIWYLDHPLTTDGEAPEPERTYTRAEDAATLRSKWCERADEMMADVTYEPRPGMACRWCPFTAARGGPCRAGV